MYVLRQTTVAISHAECIDKHVACLIPSSNLPQCIDQPEAANQKGGLREAEVVGNNIPHNVETAPKFMTDRLNGRHKTGIVMRYQTEFSQEQCAGIKVVALEGPRKRLSLGVPRAF